VTDTDLDELVARVTEATSAFIGGDMPRYFDLVDHADDFTLMGPFGGETTRDSERDRVAELEAFFRGGEATLEVVETYASGDLAVLVVVEHQRGDVGPLPPQDWSLRVTLVFRHEGSRWRLVHRHADALVHPITFDQLAELARGRVEGG
jgi:ketosteroid isomerase-like protein